MHPRAKDQNESMISAVWILFQHPFHFTLSLVLVLISCYSNASFTHSGPHQSNLCLFSFFCCGAPLLQLFRWSSWHQPCHPTALFIFSKTCSWAAMGYLFTGFFYSSFSQLSFTLIFPLFITSRFRSWLLALVPSLYSNMVATPWRNSWDHTDFSATNQFSPLSHFFFF